jgi:hypothetical protein
VNRLSNRGSQARVTSAIRPRAGIRADALSGTSHREWLGRQAITAPGPDPVPPAARPRARLSTLVIIPQPAAGDLVLAQPTTAVFTRLARAPALTGDSSSRHILSHRSTPRNKRRAPSSFGQRARHAGTLVTTASGSVLVLGIKEVSRCRWGSFRYGLWIRSIGACAGCPFYEHSDRSRTNQGMTD